MTKIELNGSEGMLCEIAMRQFIERYPNKKWIEDNKEQLDRLVAKLATWREA